MQMVPQDFKRLIPLERLEKTSNINLKQFIITDKYNSVSDIYYHHRPINDPLIIFTLYNKDINL